MDDALDDLLLEEGDMLLAHLEPLGTPRLSELCDLWDVVDDAFCISAGLSLSDKFPKPKEAGIMTISKAFNQYIEICTSSV